ncbi:MULTISPECIES: nucleoside triphosphate pyrophosphohydrolase [Empedobacter]|uniref:Nucleoside triphosphate pyrophosphohydrolase n=1 Tax=Empedobacter falsenii TaxID=343874 RepID=A0A376G7K5_9FLAO|nr:MULTISPECIES: nucleoside triphosphate pyrophosphohydrolase [Empedobacter]HAD79269.1 nucleoside triphosphate pyrophosphohydrolase [Flavobacteriaceae bacterium]MBW1618945.1 nucleoside triphosphate pyrophosphohydrolase [Empedobacter falsenii]MDH0660403.1 nucleoside triphosphate pyrophosphohydrolase [Empedobacter sp. GD03865]MDM1139470.1 nucleoside triphosphate pyrophosphohydrolase [Empedobacter sp. R132-2]MDM1546774.1 nucleoside triphosphate pyrophosphohydrolase [Empedobacter falsenii]
MNTRKDQLQAFERLLDIMDELREKCPWDRKQTMETLRTLSIEEIYELSDAIIEKDSDEIKKELGDVFLHLVFYSKIASEQNNFDVADVLNGICDKLIHRHPHIYGDVEANTEEKVLQNWEQIKLKEGNKSVLSGVPTSLPAMVKAYRIQDKVKGVGFEFENSDQVFDKIIEEINEFKEEQNPTDKEMEFGDILFSLINYGRFNGINSEDALERSNKKFITRFQKLEEIAKENGQNIADLTISELDKLWNLAKIR